MIESGAAGPHGGAGVTKAGADLDDAVGALILVHGRGGSPAGILELAGQLSRDDLAYLAPQARGSSWYPDGFTAPLEDNEPGLSSGLSVIVSQVERIEAAGIGRERIGLLGFSQGACLALEFAARNASRYAVLVGLSGGLIGPEGTPRDYPGSDPSSPERKLRRGESLRLREILG